VWLLDGTPGFSKGYWRSLVLFSSFVLHHSTKITMHFFSSLPSIFLLYQRSDTTPLMLGACGGDFLSKNFVGGKKNLFHFFPYGSFSSRQRSSTSLQD